jgi:hypothetical protein
MVILSWMIVAWRLCLRLYGYAAFVKLCDWLMCYTRDYFWLLAVVRTLQGTRWEYLSLLCSVQSDQHQAEVMLRDELTWSTTQ